MLNWKTISWATLTAVVASGCVSPSHLTYDYGRAYTASIVEQADLTRPSVAELNIFLYGNEAEQIRIRVKEKSTDVESGESKLE